MLSDNFAEKMKECILQSSLQSLMELSAEMKGRIHQDGLNSTGQKIGDYKTNEDGSYSSYMNKRISNNAQVNYVDLHVFGNLEGSFQVGIVDDRYVLGFDSDESYAIADGQTKRYGNIWKPTDEEKDFTRDTFKRIYRQCLEKSFKK